MVEMDIRVKSNHVIFILNTEPMIWLVMQSAGKDRLSHAGHKICLPKHISILSWHPAVLNKENLALSSYVSEIIS